MNTTKSKTGKRIFNHSGFSTQQSINTIDTLHRRQGRFLLKGYPIVRYVVNETPEAGYGRCRSCECRGYISKHNGSHECKNCNHHFDRHD